MMRLPRPASPRVLWRDLRALLAERGRHHWIAAGLALLIPLTVFVTFSFDVDDARRAPEQIIYVESWRADRSIEETRANIEEHRKLRDEMRAERQRQFQRLENRLGL